MEMFAFVEVLLTAGILFSACVLALLLSWWTEEAPQFVSSVTPLAVIAAFFLVHFGLKAELFVPPLAWTTLFAIVGYVAVGVIYALLEWRFSFVPRARKEFDATSIGDRLSSVFWPELPSGGYFVKTCKAYESWIEARDANRAEFMKKRDEFLSSNKGGLNKLPPDLLILDPNKFPSYEEWLKRNKLESDFDMDYYAPTAKRHKARIANWTVYWPGFFAWHLLADSFRWIGHAFYAVFGGLLNRLSRDAFKEQP